MGRRLRGQKRSAETLATRSDQATWPSWVAVLAGVAGLALVGSGTACTSSQDDEPARPKDDGEITVSGEAANEVRVTEATGRSLDVTLDGVLALTPTLEMAAPDRASDDFEVRVPLSDGLVLPPSMIAFAVVEQDTERRLLAADVDEESIEVHADGAGLLRAFAVDVDVLRSALLESVQTIGSAPLPRVPSQACVNPQGDPDGGYTISIERSDGGGPPPSICLTSDALGRRVTITNDRRFVMLVAHEDLPMASLSSAPTDVQGIMEGSEPIAGVSLLVPGQVLRLGIDLQPGESRRVSASEDGAGGTVAALDLFIQAVLRTLGQLVPTPPAGSAAGHSYLAQLLSQGLCREAALGVEEVHDSSVCLSPAVVGATLGPEWMSLLEPLLDDGGRVALAERLLTAVESRFPFSFSIARV